MTCGGDGAAHKAQADFLGQSEKGGAVETDEPLTFPYIAAERAHGGVKLHL